MWLVYIVFHSFIMRTNRFNKPKEFHWTVFKSVNWLIAHANVFRITFKNVLCLRELQFWNHHCSIFCFYWRYILCSLLLSSDHHCVCLPKYGTKYIFFSSDLKPICHQSYKGYHSSNNFTIDLKDKASDILHTTQAT